MIRHSKLWLVVASLFTFINLAGGVYSAVLGEGLHTATHVVLLVLGAYFVWRLAPRARQEHVSAGQEADERLEHLQQSVDTIALELERIGEAQRYTVKLAAERAETSPLKRPMQPPDEGL